MNFLFCKIWIIPITLGLLFLLYLLPTHAQEIRIQGKVKMYGTVTLLPERRFPFPDNLSNEYSIDIRKSGSLIPLVSQNIVTDGKGNGTLNPVDLGTLKPDEYDIAVKGFSHLREVYPRQPFLYHKYNFNLLPSLRAGDTFTDNLVNVMDLHYSDRKLYSEDRKSDLNRDGLVNSLDISNVAFNYYDTGDE